MLISSWVPPNHHINKNIGEWCKEVTQATSGRVKCDFLPKPAASPPKSADAVRDGLADISFVVDGYLPTPPVLSGISGLPFPPAETNGEAASIALQRIHNKYFAKFNEHKDLKVLAVWSGTPANFATSGKAINTVKDLEGLKIQAGSRAGVDLLKLLGAVPVAKPVSETYEMLSSGIVDGVLGPLEGVKSWRVDKYIKSVRRTPVIGASLTLFMNENSWGKIATEDRATIDKLSGERLARALGRSFDAADAEAIEVLKSNGVVPAPMPAALVQEMAAKTHSLETAWIDAAKAKGLPNAEQVLAEYRGEIIKVAREQK
jgi:TRAP-type C4-dicarboxylate transport system substrate-binding protein